MRGQIYTFILVLTRSILLFSTVEVIAYWKAVENTAMFDKPPFHMHVASIYIKTSKFLATKTGNAIGKIEWGKAIVDVVDSAVKLKTTVDSVVGPYIPISWESTIEPAIHMHIASAVLKAIHMMRDESTKELPKDAALKLGTHVITALGLKTPKSMVTHYSTDAPRLLELTVKINPFVQIGIYHEEHTLLFAHGDKVQSAPAIKNIATTEEYSLNEHSTFWLHCFTLKIQTPDNCADVWRQVRQRLVAFMLQPVVFDVELFGKVEWNTDVVVYTDEKTIEGTPSQRMLQGTLIVQNDTVKRGNDETVADTNLDPRNLFVADIGNTFAAEQEETVTGEMSSGVSVPSRTRPSNSLKLPDAVPLPPPESLSGDS